MYNNKRQLPLRPISAQNAVSKNNYISSKPIPTMTSIYESNLKLNTRPVSANLNREKIEKNVEKKNLEIKKYIERPKNNNYLRKIKSAKPFSANSKKEKVPSKDYKTLHENEETNNLINDLSDIRYEFDALSNDSLLSDIQKTNPNFLSKPNLNYNEYLFLRPKLTKTTEQHHYEQNIHKKNIINWVNEDNQKLKSKIIFFEKENKNLNKVIKEFENFLQAENDKKITDPTNQKMTEKYCADNLMIIGLKKEINDLKNKLEEKENYLEKQKKDIKLVKLQEFETELKLYSQETIRLRAILTYTTKKKFSSITTRLNNFFDTNNSENFDDFGQKIDKIKIKNMKMLVIIKELEEKIFLLKNELLNKKEVKNKNESDLKTLKRQVLEKNKTILVLQNDLSILHDKKRDLEYRAEIKSEDQLNLENLLQTEENLKKLLNEKEQIYNSNDKFIKDLKNKLQEKSNFESKEKTLLTEELGKERMMYNDKEKNYQEMLKNFPHLKERNIIFNDQSNTKNKKNKKDDESILTPKIENISKDGKNIYPKVTFDNIKQLAYEIKLRFIIKRIELQEIDQHLFTEEIQGRGYASILELKNVLLKFPFNMNDSEESLLVARYLIEDISEDKIEFNINKTNQIVMISTYFKKMIGKYTFLDLNMENKLMNEICYYVDRYGVLLRRFINENPKSKGGYLSSQEIEEIFAKALATEKQKLNPTQTEYLLLKLFEISKTLKSLDYNRIFQYFKK